MSIVDTYRGHKIFYNTNSDEWSCNDTGHDGKNYASPKLSVIRGRIDTMYRNLRSKSAIDAYELPYGDGEELVPTSVTEFIEIKHERKYSGKLGEEYHIVASIAKRDGSTKASRTSRSIGNLVPNTDAARAAHALYIAAHKEIKELTKHMNKLREAIPRLSVADIQPLIDLKAKMEDMGADDGK